MVSLLRIIKEKCNILIINSFSLVHDCNSYDIVYKHVRTKMAYLQAAAN